MHCCPNKDKILNSLASCGHNYVLPQIEYILFRNSLQVDVCFLIIECLVLNCVFRLVGCLLLV